MNALKNHVSPELKMRLKAKGKKHEGSDRTSDNWTTGPVNCLKGIAGLFFIIKHGVFKSGCLAHGLFQLSCF